MTNCWSLGIFFLFFLGSFCIWNCLHREKARNITDWYGCRDQQGKATDFSIIYKLPGNPKATQANLREGSAYIYLMPDSSVRLQSGGVSSVLSYSDSASEWILSNYSIKEDFSIPARTLKRLYNDNSFKKVAAVFMYNDEFPNGSTSITYGHTKGVIVLSDFGGYWIIHSAPKFPPPMNEGYSYPSTALRYGQIMLCISLPSISDAISESIAGQLNENDIDIYSWNLPDTLSSKYPVLKEILNKNKPKQPPYYRIAQIPTYNGKTFTSFAKSKYFNEDLYSRLVAPSLKTNLLVESWRNGPSPLPSSCNSTFHVENIESIFSKSASFEFTTHKDHSKWAVAQDPDKPYVCIGDINRMETQFTRGGGTVCLWSAELVAIILALRYIADWRGESFVMYSDSRSALEAMHSHQMSHPFVAEVIRWLIRLSSIKKVTFCWVPAHVEVGGNEHTDKTARLTSSLPTSDLSLPHLD